MATADRLDPLPPVVAGGLTFLVDRSRPVAVLRASDGSQRVATWPDAPLPGQAASPSAYPAPGCVWVVYSEGTMDGSGASTAVRVGADGQVATCELGLLGAVGADDQGVWTCADPHLAMGDGLGGSDEEPDQVEQDVEDPHEPPPWVREAPVVSWEDYERAGREGADALALGDVEQFEAASLQIGEGESFGWFAYPPGQEPEEPALLPDPPPPASTGPVTLRRVRADGADEVVVSRVVSRIEAVGAGVLRLVFHPTGPVYTADGRGGHLVGYPRRVAEVDVADGLPATIDLDAVPSQPFEDEDRDEYEWEPEPAIAESDRVDLSGVAGTRWALRTLGPGEVEAAVRAIVEQYAALDEPNTVWTRRDNSWQRVQSEFADVHVHTEGRWPDTEVVVDFTYRPEPEAPLRRRTRVFDDTGAPAISSYLTVYLDEDLATTDLDDLPVHEGHRHI